MLLLLCDRQAVYQQVPKINSGDMGRGSPDTRYSISNWFHVDSWRYDGDNSVIMDDIA